MHVLVVLLPRSLVVCCLHMPDSVGLVGLHFLHDSVSMLGALYLNQQGGRLTPPLNCAGLYLPDVHTGGLWTSYRLRL